MQGNVLEQVGKKLNIDGIWNDYIIASGGNVNANDFVKYIKEEEVGDRYSNSNLISGSNTNNDIVAVQLSRNKILFLHDINTNRLLYGVVFEIEGTVITQKSVTQLTSRFHYR